MERFDTGCVNAVVVGQEDPHGGRSVRFVSIAGGKHDCNLATRTALAALR
jgi:hypothetical protein